MIKPPGKDDADKARILHDQPNYPVWRAVDVMIDSWFVVRLRQRSEQKGPGSL